MFPVISCAYPSSEQDLAELEAEGVTLLINLHTRSHPSQELAGFGLRELHLPTPDFTPPEMADIVKGIAAVDRELASGHRVAVHCGAGLGRTGTFVACYHVHRGMPPDEAIAEVRRARPRSIETPEQEARVYEYYELSRGS